MTREFALSMKSKSSQILLGVVHPNLNKYTIFGHSDSFEGMETPYF